MYDQTANYERELARELGDVPLCQDLDRNIPIDVLWAYTLEFRIVTPSRKSRP